MSTSEEGSTRSGVSFSDAVARAAAHGVTNAEASEIASEMRPAAKHYGRLGGRCALDPLRVLSGASAQGLRFPCARQLDRFAERVSTKDRTRDEWATRPDEPATSSVLENLTISSAAIVDEALRSQVCQRCSSANLRSSLAAASVTIGHIRGTPGCEADARSRVPEDGHESD